MITALIPTLNSGRDLQILLSALVPASVEGLVRQVIVVDGGSTDETLAICEDAGTTVAGGGLAAASAGARYDWLLVAPVSLRLRRGWEDLLAEHLRQGGGRALIEGLKVKSGLLSALSVGEAAVLVERAAVAGLPADVDPAGVRRKLGRGAAVLR